MYRPHRLERLAVGGIVAAVVFIAYLVLEIIDRVTASPAMRKRVNAGTDKFLAERGSIWQAASRAASHFLGEFGYRGFWDP